MGVFRESGQNSKIETLREEYDAGVDVDLDSNPIADEAVVSGLLKLFVREITPKVFNADQALRVVETAKTRDEDAVVHELKACVSEISPTYRSLLHALMHLLSRVAANKEVNRMTSDNLGIVFSQVLFEEKDTEEDPMQKMMKFIKPLNWATKFFIDKYSEIFEDLPIEILLERKQSSIAYHVSHEDEVDNDESDEDDTTPDSTTKSNIPPGDEGKVDAAPEGSQKVEKAENENSTENNEKNQEKQNDSEPEPPTKDDLQDNNESSSEVKKDTDTKEPKDVNNEDDNKSKEEANTSSADGNNKGKEKVDDTD